MPLFVRLTIGIALAIVAVIVAFFVLKLVIAAAFIVGIAALLAALATAGIVVFRFVRAARLRLDGRRSLVRRL